MPVTIRAFTPQDIAPAIAIWNEVVEEGVAFPQVETLNETSGMAFFTEQSFTGLAVDDDTQKVLGLYILHPNNVGRCGHICNASYAVASGSRGRHIGYKLVEHSLQKGKELGFSIMQFNAVVATNQRALHLYQTLGFVKVGVIPKGFSTKNGRYEDIVVHYKTL